MDVYSLHASAAKVIEYLEKVDADAAARAKARYRCFDKWVPHCRRLASYHIAIDGPR